MLAAAASAGALISNGHYFWNRAPAAQNQQVRAFAERCTG